MLAGVAAVISLACIQTASAADKKTLAFVVNGASDFWKAAEAGVKKAQGELPNYIAGLQISRAGRGRDPDPADGRPRRRRRRRHHGQRRRPEDLERRLNRIGGQVALFTTDSDAPNTSRIAYIGSSNTDAGKQAGQLV